MPMYRYKCPCGKELQILRPMKDSSKRKMCPSCGRKMVKQITVPTRDTAWENGVFLEHASIKGEYFKNRTELRRYQKKHQIESSALL